MEDCLLEIMEILFPASGACYDGERADVGDYGSYWSSSLDSDSSLCGRTLYFFSDDCGIDCCDRNNGRAVRGVVSF